MTDRIIPLVPEGRSGRSGGEAPVFEKIGIVGLGLIGGSIALAARELWPSGLVIAVDDKAVLEKAMVRHAIDVAADDPVVLAEADLIVLAAPVQQNLVRLGELDAYVSGPAIVTDVGSTKRAIVRAARSLPPRFTFVGGHPLGGAARSGIDFARPDLFKARPWIFTPSGDGTGAALERLFEFAGKLGARPSTMTAEAHDRLLAFISHLPQLTASALMKVIGETVDAEGLALAGRGLADTTRLASSPSAVWREITATNADRIGEALDALIAELTTLRTGLARAEVIDAIFDAANGWKERMPS